MDLGGVGSECGQGALHEIPQKLIKTLCNEKELTFPVGLKNQTSYINQSWIKENNFAM